MDLKNQMTFQELSGRRKLRAYVLVAIALMALIFAGWMVFLGSRLNAASAEGRRATELASVPTMAEPTLTPTVTPVPTQAPCPADYLQWSYRLPGEYATGNLMKIEPPCVYAGLERSVAWTLLAQSMGYSGEQAAELLGFAEMTFRPVQQIVMNSDSKKEIEMGMTAPFILPTTRFWLLDGDGKPAVTISMRGCYEGYHFEGTLPVVWGTYSVVCKVAFDIEQGSGGWKIADFESDSDFYVIKAKNNRRVLGLYGYVGNHIWVLLGFQRDPVIEYEKTALDPESDRNQKSEAFGLPAWDAGWVENRYGFGMNPLPVEWRTYAEQDHPLDEVGLAMSKFLKDQYAKSGGSQP